MRVLRKILRQIAVYMGIKPSYAIMYLEEILKSNNQTNEILNEINYTNSEIRSTLNTLLSEQHELKAKQEQSIKMLNNINLTGKTIRSSIDFAQAEQSKILPKSQKYYSKSIEMLNNINLTGKVIRSTIESFNNTRNQFYKKRISIALDELFDFVQTNMKSALFIGVTGW